MSDPRGSLIPLLMNWSPSVAGSRRRGRAPTAAGPPDNLDGCRPHRPDDRPQDHLAFLGTQRSASFLQTPAWGRVKSEWRRESLGWYAGPDGTDLVGAGLVL